MRNIKQKVQNLLSKGLVVAPVVLSEAQLSEIANQIPPSGTPTKEGIESVLTGEIETHTHKLTEINYSQIRRMQR